MGWTVPFWVSDDDFACLESIVRNSYGENNKKDTFPADRIRKKEGRDSETNHLEQHVWNNISPRPRGWSKTR